MKMKCYIIALIMSCTGCLTLCSQTCNGTEQENCSLAQADSVVRENSVNTFAEIYVKHKNDDSLLNLKWIKDYWGFNEYMSKQKGILKQMANKIIEQIPVQSLNEFLRYKFNPIICKLVITPHEGVIKKVTFMMNPTVSSHFTDNDIRVFENIILNTRLTSDDSLDGDIATWNWVVSRNQIREFLQSQQNKLTE